MKRGKKKKGCLVKLHPLVIILSYSHRPHPHHQHPKTMGKWWLRDGSGWWEGTHQTYPHPPSSPIPRCKTTAKLKYLSSGTCFASVVLARTQTYNLSTSSWAWFCFLVEFSPDSNGKRPHDMSCLVSSCKAQMQEWSFNHQFPCVGSAILAGLLLHYSTVVVTAKQTTEEEPHRPNVLTR